ncbi:MAG: hypothetical protein ACJAZT_000955 [Gammaproteobacteria bacterium]|jgi:hypothetical protein
MNNFASSQCYASTLWLVTESEQNAEVWILKCLNP